MAYSTCLNNESHYGRVCDTCSCCERCCECGRGSAGVAVTNQHVGLREVSATENKAAREMRVGCEVSGTSFAAGTYKVHLSGDLSSMAGNHNPRKTKTVERWFNSAAEEADLFARWAAKGIIAKRGRFVGR